MTPYFEADGVTLYHGDCLDVMRGMAADSVDAIVTDPPYGLSFMGKNWDKGVPGEAFWVEALRVAKPGAHLLAFGGTRTFHRLAVAIEDSGWEIRDCVMWVYGSGFPKSLDVSKAIDRAAGAEREVVGQKVYADGKIRTAGVNNTMHEGWQRPWRVEDPQRGERLTAPATPESAQWSGWGTALKPAQETVILARKPLDCEQEQCIIVMSLFKLEVKLWLLLNANTAERASRLSQKELDEALSIAQWSVEEPGNTLDALRGLMDTSRLESAISTTLSTVSSWRSTWEESLKLGSTFITETAISQIIDWRTLSCSVLALTPQNIIKAAMIQPGLWCSVLPAASILNAISTKLSATLELFAVENAIDKGLISRPDGVDQTILSSPIILARKPLAGTVTANVLEYGTGAINIDGCRIEVEDQETFSSNWNRKTVSDIRGGNFKTSTAGAMTNRWDAPQGRWPANVIHDGSEEVLALFPKEGRSTKPTAEGKPRNGREESGSIFGTTGSIKYNAAHNDNGGSAARFFYCAKASKQDRDEGCEEIEAIGKVYNGQNQEGAGCAPGSVEDKFTTSPAHNFHPTVKPTDLMRYLCRLITPPGGVILDPFIGSGSTGKAAALEGFAFVGIEIEAQYLEIAQARIERAKLQPRLFPPADDSATPRPQQAGLFEEDAS